MADKIKEINKQSKKLILKKIDRFALLVEIDQPDFYKEYHNFKIALFSKNDDDKSAKKQEVMDLELDQEQLVPKELKQKNLKKSKKV